MRQWLQWCGAARGWCRGSVLVPVVAVVTLTAACGTSGGDGSQATPPLKFTAIPDQNSTELEEKFQPFAAHLGEALGVDVEYLPARDYQAAVEMFKNGDSQLAWLGGLTGVQARNAVPGARAIAQGASDPEFYSYFIAHRDAGLVPSSAFPEGLAGLRFTFGSQSSTSGRLMPEYFIRRSTGQAPEELFAEPIGFSGSHDRTIELVESGQYDMGVVNYLVFDQRVEAGQTDAEVVQIIWQTPPYADYNWTAHPALDEMFGAGFVDRLQGVLTAIDDPALLTALPRDRLIDASDEEYEGIRTVAKQLDMLR